MIPQLEFHPKVNQNQFYDLHHLVKQLMVHHLLIILNYFDFFLNYLDLKLFKILSIAIIIYI
jgi:hypothetical protein